MESWIKTLLGLDRNVRNAMHIVKFITAGT